MPYVKIKKNSLIIISLLFGLLSFSNVTNAANFDINEKQVNQYLAQNGNISNRLGFGNLLNIDYKLQNLSAKIGQNVTNRIELSGIVDGLFKLPQYKFPATLNVTIDTIPYYDPQKGAIYLKDLRVLHLSGLPPQYQLQAQSISPLLKESLAALVGSMPIYTLNENDSHEQMIKKFAKAIKVEKGKIVLETTLF